MFQGIGGMAAAQQQHSSIMNELMMQHYRGSLPIGLTNDNVKPKKNKKEKTNTRKEVLTKEEAEKKANEILKGESFEDLLKKAKEQTKKPC